MQEHQMIFLLQPLLLAAHNKFSTLSMG